ncbi:response regulator transcription factor [uncultured Amnibacterium sp.]|uniref:response regulator transcription factor n=1 Tax=uncultured Amnibacterium sp. TaxID=1631851 RepID=UPI0035CC464D
MSDEGVVRVAVLDARAVVRAGVGALLDGRDGIAVVGSFASGAQLRSWARPFDVLVVDPALDGGQALAPAVARATALGAGVLALADAHSSALIRAVAAAGASGVVLQTAEPGVLADAVLGVARYPGPMFRVWTGAAEAQPVPDAGLNRGERQVLALYASGVKAEAVARTIGLSASTVTTYVSRIRRKYERAGRAASSRVDLYRRAVEDGVLAGEALAAAG